MKRLVILFLPVFLSVLVRPAAAQTPVDLVYHAMPTVPTFDIPEEVSQVAGNLQSSVNQSKQIILQAKSDITNMQSAVMSTYENIKNGSIILMHNNADNVVDALRLCLDYLTMKGYKVSSVGELIYSDGYHIDANGVQHKD